MSFLSQKGPAPSKGFWPLSERDLKVVTGGSSAGKNSELDDLTAGSEVPEL